MSLPCVTRAVKSNMTEFVKTAHEKIHAANKPRVLKRFYKTSTAAKDEQGWHVLLDGKAVKTPGKRMLVLPTQSLAEAIAQEWDSQGEEIDLQSLPLMQFACATLDYVQPHMSDVVSETLGYAETDALCYREVESDVLAERQKQAWNPVVSWANARYGIEMRYAQGIMPVEQAPHTREQLHAVLEKLSPHALASLWLMTKHLGSLLLALAVFEKQVTVSEAFSLSRLEEAFQNEQWGEDEEVRERREIVAAEMEVLARFLTLISA